MMALSVLVFVLLAAGGVRLARVRDSLRGDRLVQCPENGAMVPLALDLQYSAVCAALGFPRFRVRDCGRWPGHSRCGQTCLRDLAASPDESRTPVVVARWYACRHCVFCGRAFANVDADRPSALLCRDGVTRRWTDFRSRDIPTTLADSIPLCWYCAIEVEFCRANPAVVHPALGGSVVVAGREEVGGC